MTEAFASEAFILTLVTGVYMASVWLFKKTKIALLNPLLTSIFLLAAFLRVTQLPYETFAKGSRLISFLLGPSVVALGYLLYEEAERLKTNAVSILTSVFVGSFVGVASVILVARLFGADQTLILSLEPKSVTTPIAMSVSERAGGIASLTAVIVVAVGIFGALTGPFILKKLGIESRIAKGLALGSAAHGLGTARAVELGAVEGAVSGLAIGVMGVMTALLVPLINLLFI